LALWPLELAASTVNLNFRPLQTLLHNITQCLCTALLVKFQQSPGFGSAATGSEYLFDVPHKLRGLRSDQFDARRRDGLRPAGTTNGQTQRRGNGAL
jgi:hypothetical protein